MSAWDIYWLTRFESLSSWLFIFSFFTILIGISGYFFVSMAICDKIIKSNKWFLLPTALLLCGLSSSLLGVLMPSKSDLAIIFAGEWVTNSEEVKKLPDNVIGTMNKFMQNYLDEDKK